jgi:hypothetical protein
MSERMRSTALEAILLESGAVPPRRVTRMRSTATVRVYEGFEAVLGPSPGSSPRSALTSRRAVASRSRPWTSTIETCRR